MMQARCFSNGIAIRYREDGANGKNKICGVEKSLLVKIYLYL